MPRKEASDLVLRARIALERLRSGEADHSLVNLLSQVLVITSFITRAGHGKLAIEDIERVERGLGEVVVAADRGGTWNVPGSLIEALTAVVNEYDRQLCTTRMEIVARASEHLDRLVVLAAHYASSPASDRAVTR
ncbi:MAG: hypothetical protein EPN70_00835 [Paraburkholderia sp.]|uniref:hypothetical protein n=1 Tax=Paraburkholderia sp. TaxID=1926495 RepID=UPI00121D1BC3|nr:hypothetical protein [Paraburkholderia sp.]TAM08242.1 MAG: hypothetical protein EPN70_00835 [Paraburkholderia sp.]